MDKENNTPDPSTRGNNSHSVKECQPQVDGIVVEFEDGTKINTKNLDYRLIKPLIWWE